MLTSEVAKGKAKDAEIFSVDSIHQQYWKDFCDVCYPRFGFESKEDGERSYDQKYETFRQCHVFAMQQFEWNEAMMFKVHEQDLQRFHDAYEFFATLSTDDNAAIPMLVVLLRIQQSIWNRLREDRRMMEYIYPRNCNISCEKYKVDFVANSPEDEHVVKDMGDLEKNILDKLYFERDWDYGWQQDISKAMVHQVDYYNDEKIEWDETAGSLTRQLARTIIDSYNYSLSTFESEYEHLVTARHGSVIHAIVYRLFMSYQTSLDEIKSIIEDYPAEICLDKLADVRSKLIEKFKKNKLGMHWYECIKSQNGLEKVGRFLVNHRNTISEEEEERFFYLLDEICIITDILKGNAAKYWLNVEYEHMEELPEASIEVQKEPRQEVAEERQQPGLEDTEEVAAKTDALRNDADLIEKLKPIFYNNETDVRAFLKEIAGMKPGDITDLVNRWVQEKRISDYGNSRKGELWKILYDAKLYSRTIQNWNRRVY